MANHVPAVPSDLALSVLSYQANLPQASSGPNLEFGDGASGSLAYPISGIGAAFTFSTPGTLGTFDQDTFEAAFAATVTGICQVIASMTGVTLESLQASVTISRAWQYTDSSGFTCGFADSLAYPPA